MFFHQALGSRLGSTGRLAQCRDIYVLPEANGKRLAPVSPGIPAILAEYYSLIWLVHVSALLRVLDTPPRAPQERLAYTHPSRPDQWRRLFALHRELKDLEQHGIDLFGGTHADDAMDFAKRVLIKQGIRII